ncbi:hypothetical protein, partial [Nereida ignava]|uniref:hypothetical protein n=1 Tax=Nereida ignava TaxID=282199 RepID=UPI0030FBC02C
MYPPQKAKDMITDLLAQLDSYDTNKDTNNKFYVRGKRAAAAFLKKGTPYKNRTAQDLATAAQWPYRVIGGLAALDSATESFLDQAAIDNKLAADSSQSKFGLSGHVVEACAFRRDILTAFITLLDSKSSWNQFDLAQKNVELLYRFVGNMDININSPATGYGEMRKRFIDMHALITSPTSTIKFLIVPTSDVVWQRSPNHPKESYMHVLAAAELASTTTDRGTKQQPTQTQHNWPWTETNNDAIYIALAGRQKKRMKGVACVEWAGHVVLQPQHYTSSPKVVEALHNVAMFPTLVGKLHPDNFFPKKSSDQEPFTHLFLEAMTKDPTNLNFGWESNGFVSNLGHTAPNSRTFTSNAVVLGTEDLQRRLTNTVEQLAKPGWGALAKQPGALQISTDTATWSPNLYYDASYPGTLIWAANDVSAETARSATESALQFATNSPDLVTTLMAIMDAHTVADTNMLQFYTAVTLTGENIIIGLHLKLLWILACTTGTDNVDEAGRQAAPLLPIWSDGTLGLTNNKMGSTPAEDGITQLHQWNIQARDLKLNITDSVKELFPIKTGPMPPKMIFTPSQKTSTGTKMQVKDTERDVIYTVAANEDLQHMIGDYKLTATAHLADRSRCGWYTNAAISATEHTEIPSLSKLADALANLSNGLSANKAVVAGIRALAKEKWPEGTLPRSEYVDSVILNMASMHNAIKQDAERHWLDPWADSFLGNVAGLTSEDTKFGRLVAGRPATSAVVGNARLDKVYRAAYQSTAGDMNTANNEWLKTSLAVPLLYKTENQDPCSYNDTQVAELKNKIVSQQIGYTDERAILDTWLQTEAGKHAKEKSYADKQSAMHAYADNVLDKFTYENRANLKSLNALWCSADKVKDFLGTPNKSLLNLLIPHLSGAADDDAGVNSAVKDAQLGTLATLLESIWETHGKPSETSGVPGGAAHAVAVAGRSVGAATANPSSVSIGAAASSINIAAAKTNDNALELKKLQNEIANLERSGKNCANKNAEWAAKEAEHRHTIASLRSIIGTLTKTVETSKHSTPKARAAVAAATALVVGGSATHTPQKDSEVAAAALKDTVACRFVASEDLDFQRVTRDGAQDAHAPLLAQHAGYLAAHIWGNGAATLAHTGSFKALASAAYDGPEPFATLMETEAKRLGYINPGDVMHLPRFADPSVQCGRCDRLLKSGDNCKNGEACKLDQKHVFCMQCANEGCSTGSTVLKPATFGPDRDRRALRATRHHIADPFPTSAGTQVSPNTGPFVCIGCVRLAAIPEPSALERCTIGPSGAVGVGSDDEEEGEDAPAGTSSAKPEPDDSASDSLSTEVASDG